MPRTEGPDDDAGDDEDAVMAPVATERAAAHEAARLDRLRLYAELVHRFVPAYGDPAPREACPLDGDVEAARNLALEAAFNAIRRAAARDAAPAAPDPGRVD